MTGNTMAEEEKTIAEDLVVTKYKMAGDIVNRKCSFDSSVQQAYPSADEP